MKFFLLREVAKEFDQTGGFESAVWREFDGDGEWAPFFARFEWAVDFFAAPTGTRPPRVLVGDPAYQSGIDTPGGVLTYPGRMLLIEEEAKRRFRDALGKLGVDGRTSTRLWYCPSQR
jgi:hypothetical protein